MSKRPRQERGPPRVVFGRRPVEELLAARSAECQAIFVAGDPPATLVRALERAGLEAEPADGETLDRLAGGGNHQGVLAICGEFVYAEPGALIEAAAARGLPVLALDQVQDPRNLGAILRSAEVLGAAGAIIPARRAVGITPVVVRTAAGATEHLLVARVKNLGRALDELKQAGHWLVGAVGEGGQAPESLDLVDRAVLVLGSEGRGLRRTVLEACDFRVSIPMAGRVGSLNVSVAAGVLLAEAARQRRASH